MNIIRQPTQNLIKLLNHVPERFTPHLRLGKFRHPLHLKCKNYLIKYCNKNT